MVGQERDVHLNFADDADLLVDSWLVMVAMVVKNEEVTQRPGISFCISAETKEV